MIVVEGLQYHCVGRLKHNCGKMVAIQIWWQDCNTIVGVGLQHNCGGRVATKCWWQCCNKVVVAELQLNCGVSVPS